MIIKYKNNRINAAKYNSVEDFFHHFFISRYDYLIQLDDKIVPNDYTLGIDQEVSLLPVRNTNLFEHIFSQEDNNSSELQSPFCCTTCDICHNANAITYTVRLSGIKSNKKIYFCKNCFIKSIERVVSYNIKNFLSAKKSQLILIPVSGGKDGIATAHFINEYRKENDIRLALLAYTIIINGNPYERIGHEHAIKFCQKNNIPHISIDVSSYIKEQYFNCYLCANIKDYIDKALIDLLQANIIAFGTNYSDKIRHKFFSTLLNTNLAAFQRIYTIDDKCCVVAPLLDLKDCDVFLYLKCKSIDFLEHYKMECPYSENAYRNMQTVVSNMVDDYYPGLIDYKIADCKSNVYSADINKKLSGINFNEISEYIERIIQNAKLPKRIV